MNAAVGTIVTQDKLGYNGVVITEPHAKCVVVRWHKWQTETFSQPEFGMLVELGKLSPDNTYPTIRAAQLAMTVTLGKCTMIPHQDGYEVRSGVWHYRGHDGWVRATNLMGEVL